MSPKQPRPGKPTQLPLTSTLLSYGSQAAHTPVPAEQRLQPSSYPDWPWLDAQHTPPRQLPEEQEASKVHVLPGPEAERDRLAEAVRDFVAGAVAEAVRDRPLEGDSQRLDVADREALRRAKETARVSGHDRGRGGRGWRGEVQLSMAP